jgi:2-dehydropantoate 2-reductase
VIVHTSPFAKLRCGRIDGRDDEALETFADAASKAGIDIETSREMDRVRWEKFTFLVAMSGITASTRVTIGAAMSDPDIKAMFRAMMTEVVAVARASGANLTDAFLEEQFKFAEGVPPGMKASMAHDLERGNRLELDWLSGKVVELGRKFAVPVPANEAIYAILKPHRLGTAQ